MKVGIVIIVYNIDTAIFLLQLAAIKKYCTDDFEINIFDNSSTEEYAAAIKYHSEQQRVNYTRAKSSQATGSDSHSFCANLSYLLLKNRYKYFFYLDHDCIPVSYFSVTAAVGYNFIYAGIGQKEVNTYLWPGCFMFNNDKINKDLIDFSPSHELGLDTGGGLHKIVSEYGKDQGIFFKEEYFQNPEFHDKLYGHYAIIQDTFMHFIGASNWMGIEKNQERINSLISIVKEKTQL